MSAKNIKMIISVHTPKCGGTSFKKILSYSFKSNLILDYHDKPMNKTFIKRTEDAENFKNSFNAENYNKKTCIHGHFLPYKYSNLLGKPNVLFVTWLRDPIERLASNYYFWKRNAQKNNQQNFGDFRKKVLEEQWSFEEFCFSEERRNIYSNYFWKFHIDNFDFIGISECFDTELKYFANEFLKEQIYFVPKENVNETKIGSYFSDDGFRTELKSFHSKDYELYQYALDKRLLRINNSAPKNGNRCASLKNTNRFH